MKVVIASGKGGTGKSTVSVNVARLLSEKVGGVALLDCDVEEPNDHLFLHPQWNHTEPVCISSPEIDYRKCQWCGQCVRTCEFNAMAMAGNRILVFEELCHGCNACKISCPHGAINSVEREIGVLEAALREPLSFIHGRSRVGSAMSPALIRRVKQYADEKAFAVQIIDSPPGTSCPFINTVYGADYVILVAEPTPFGFYDLKLATDVVRQMNIPFGVVINKSNEHDALIETWAKENNIRIISKIPEDMKIAQSYSGGEIIAEALPETVPYFSPIVDLIDEGQRA